MHMMMKFLLIYQIEQSSFKLPFKCIERSSSVYKSIIDLVDNRVDNRLLPVVNLFRDDYRLFLDDYRLNSIDSCLTSGGYRLTY